MASSEFAWICFNCCRALWQQGPQLCCMHCCSGHLRSLEVLGQLPAPGLLLL